MEAFSQAEYDQIVAYYKNKCATLELEYVTLQLRNNKEVNSIVSKLKEEASQREAVFKQRILDLELTLKEKTDTGKVSKKMYGQATKKKTKKEK